MTEGFVPVFAPWTEEQVDALYEYQHGGWGHPFTCGSCRDKYHVEGTLVATTDGWTCETCDDVQAWAYAAMFEGPPPGWKAFISDVVPVKTDPSVYETGGKLSRPRWWAKFRARLFRQSWIACPLCGEEFASFEAGDVRMRSVDAEPWDFSLTCERHKRPRYLQDMLSV